jgi:beta-lactam-binding protein with PASTA domain
MTVELEKEDGPELRPAPPTEAVAGTLETWLKRLLPLALAVILLSAAIWSINIYGRTIYRDYLKVPSEVKVPEVTNLEIKEAYEAIEAAGLLLQVHENRYDKKVKKRVVLSQNPEGGKMVREGRTILVVVSLGPELMDVPKLTGESLRTAKIALSNAKLRVGEVTFEEAEYGLDEEVVKQNPSAGKAVPRGERIHLRVRRGSR